MDKRIYKSAKDTFLDVINVNEYIQLDTVSTIFTSIELILEQPIKMVLLFGKPGTGKSMMLRRLYDELKEKQIVVMYDAPCTNELEFLESLSKNILPSETFNELTFTQFIKRLKKTNFKNIPVVLLDEAQLYPNSLLEIIRLISDTRKIKFLITVHKTHKEDLIAKDHFQTRIWKSVELHNASKQELLVYIQKKLLMSSLFELANLFKKNQVDIIYKFTKGNYRDTNKLLYTLFELYIDYLQQTTYKISTKFISKKIIEMAAIKVGFVS